MDVMNTTESSLSDNEILAAYIDFILTQVKWAITIPALLISFITVLVFIFNKKLRQQHNIFPFNIALADMMAILNYALLLGGAIYHRVGTVSRFIFIPWNFVFLFRFPSID